MSSLLVGQNQALLNGLAGPPGQNQVHNVFKPKISVIQKYINDICISNSLHAKKSNKMNIYPQIYRNYKQECLTIKL